MSLMPSDLLLAQLAPNDGIQDTAEGHMPLQSPSSEHNSINFDDLDLTVTPSGKDQDFGLVFQSLISPEYAGTDSDVLNVLDPEDVVPTSDDHSSANVGVQDPPEDDGQSDTANGMHARSTRSSKRNAQQRKALDSDDEYRPSDDDGSSKGTSCARKRPHRSAGAKEPNRNAIMAKLNREKKKQYVASLEEKIAALEHENTSHLQTIASQQAAFKQAQAEITRLRAAVKAAPAIASVLKTLNGDNAVRFGSPQANETTIPLQLNLSVAL
eukprot:TRINITY_DN8272_c0_g1_i2.p1 TRINITY_DN8272_c0_g1~~TRINITY_DN8272_c0_g1_i2.p1  ORF type:complete len:269 (+),score=72.30 TRINITY_DN8272_c0_g1_i2:215-1021(+)